MFRLSVSRLSSFRLTWFQGGALTITLLSLSTGPLLWSQSPDLPSGAVQAKVRTACLECHEFRIIVQQRLSKGAWTKEVDKMIKWGAVVDATDRDGFVDYLSANFPADKPAEPVSRVTTPKKR
jgi:hypothetical protein